MSGLSQIGRSQTFWIGTVVIFSYWIVAPWLDTNSQTEWLRAILISVGATIVVAYTPGVIKFLITPSPVQAQQLTMGIVVAWFGTAMAGIYLLLWRMAGQPPWMVNNDLNGWWLWWQIVGGVLHLTAPRSIENEIPRPNFARLRVALLAGVALGYTVAVMKPDAAGFVDKLRPYIGDALRAPDNTG